MFYIWSVLTIIKSALMSMLCPYVHLMSYSRLLWSKVLRIGQKNNSCIWVTQENSIEISLQTSLSFILLPMVCAHYCAPYPKWPCVEHKVNMWYPYCIMLFVLEPSTLFFQVLWPMLWPHHQIVTDVTVWLITSDPNPKCSKNRKIKMRKKNKINEVHFLQS